MTKTERELSLEEWFKKFNVSGFTNVGSTIIEVQVGNNIKYIDIQECKNNFLFKSKRNNNQKNVLSWPQKLRLQLQRL